MTSDRCYKYKYKFRFSPIIHLFMKVKSDSSNYSKNISSLFFHFVLHQRRKYTNRPHHTFSFRFPFFEEKKKCVENFLLSDFTSPRVHINLMSIEIEFFTYTRINFFFWWEKKDTNFIRSLPIPKTACWKYTSKSNWMATVFFFTRCAYHFSNSIIHFHTLHSFYVSILLSFMRYGTRLFSYDSVFRVRVFESWKRSKFEQVIRFIDTLSDSVHIAKYYFSYFLAICCCFVE